MDRGAVDDVRPAARRRAAVQVDERGRDDVDAMAALDQARTSSRATTTGPPKARAGQYAGLARTIDSGTATAETLPLPP